MGTVLKGLTGDVTVTVAGKSLNFVNYGASVRLEALVGIAADDFPTAGYFSITPVSYASVGTEPPGFALNTSTGVLSWTPTGPYGDTIVIRATDAGAGSEDIEVSLSATEAPSTLIAGRNTTFVPSGSPDSVALVTPPARGNVIPRQDGNFTILLNDEPDDTSDLSFTYDKTVGAVTTRHTANLTVRENLYKKGGWAEGKFYFPETDPTGAIVVEPIEGTKVIHIAAAGISQQDLLDRHAGTGDAIDTGGYTAGTIRRGVVTDTPARNADGTLVLPTTYYGDTEALAVDQFNGGLIVRHVRDSTINDGTSQLWVLFKRGDTFTENFVLDYGLENNGYSALHPNLIGAYGTGDRPFFDSTVFDATTAVEGHNYVAQDLHMNLSSLDFRGIQTNKIADNLKNVGCRSRHEGSSNLMADAFTLYRYVSLDSTRTVPAKSTDTVWTDGERDEFSGSRLNGLRNIFMYKSYISGAGWSFVNGYRGDRLIDGANKAPDIYGHSVYCDTDCHEVYFKDCLFLNNCHSAVQIRPGGIVDNMFTAGNNTGFAPVGNGASDTLDGNGRGGWSHWSMLYRYGQSEGGFKDWEGNGSITAGGIFNNANETSIWDSFVVNWTTKTPYTDPTATIFGAPRPNRDGVGKILGNGTAFGFRNRNGDPDRPMPLSGSTSRFDLIINNWNRENAAENGGDQNVGSVPQATRDALSIGDYADGVMSSSGETLRTFDLDFLRTLDDPWVHVEGLNNHFLTPFGKERILRVSGETVRFEPDAGGHTPGQLAMFDGDWHTKDQPGTAVGDSVDLQGHSVTWINTPENRLVDFAFSGRNAMQQWGGKLDFSGTITCDAGGNDWNLYRGAKLNLTNTPAGGILNVNTYESRLSFDDTVSDNVDAGIWGRSEFLIEDGGAITFASGRTLNIGGLSKAGFDGSSGSASLTMVSGSTLAFKRGCLIQVDGVKTYGGLSAGAGMREAAGLPEPGDVIESASGATGRVIYAYQQTASNAGGYTNSVMIFVDDITGTFVDGEDLFGPTQAGMFYIGDSRMGLGAAGGFDDLEKLGVVGRAPTYEIAAINEFVSGRYGDTTPSIASSVTLASGSTVTVDTSGLAPGTYDLIDVDSFTDNGATLPAGVSESGGKLVLTV